VALDQRDGHIVWEAASAKQFIGATAVAGGAAFIGGSDGLLRAHDVRDGRLLWSTTIGPILGGIAVSHDSILVGSADGSVRAFRLPLTSDPPAAGPVVQILAPNTTLKLKGGSTYTIRWSLTGSGVQRQDVSLSLDGGQSWQDVSTGLPASATSYDWTVPNVKSGSGRIRVRAVTEGSEGVEDQSDADFTIKKKKKG
jgi:hypothetical protein